MPKTILVITDVHETGKCSLTKACDIAAPLGAQIDVVQFIKTKANEQPSQTLVDEQDATLRATLADMFENYEYKEQITSQIAVTSNIVQWVVDYCNEKDFDLIVKAGHRSETLFHTPCDWALIRELQVPVLISSQKHWRNKHNVLAAVNANAKDEVHKQLNHQILHWAKRWAETFDCTIHLVYSMPVSKILKELDIIDIKEYARKHQGEGEQMLTALLEGEDLPNVKIHVTAGPPEKTIPHCANELKSELVIMGSMGRKGLASMVKPNIAEKVMHHLRTDSLIVERKK